MKAIKRSSGVLLHVSSLHGEYSIGSFGRPAFEFVDFLADAGFGWWQVLPFCVPDECGSPYKSEASFAGNPSFIDLPLLAAEGLLTAEELEAAKQKTPFAVESERLALTREALLRVAAARATNRAEILAFVEKNAELANACRFLALKRANGGKPWQEAVKVAADYTAECIRLTMADPEGRFYGVNFEQAIPYLLNRMK